MGKIFRYAPAVLLILYLVFKIAPHLSTGDTNEYEPTTSQKRQLEPVVDLLADHPEAAKQFQGLYFGMALVVGADEVILRTTEDVRKAHENAGALAIQAGEIERIPGYAKVVNEFLIEEIGRDNVPLDSQKRKQIIDAFKALAWATNQ